MTHQMWTVLITPLFGVSVMCALLSPVSPCFFVLPRLTITMSRVMAAVTVLPGSHYDRILPPHPPSVSPIHHRSLVTVTPPASSTKLALCMIL